MSVVQQDTDRFTVIDCENAFSQGLTTESTQYHLRDGEFDVQQPYYTTSSIAGQKRKRGHDSETLTADWHETNARPFLSPILPIVKEAAFGDRNYTKVSSPSSETNDDSDPGDPINFASLTELAQASQRFFQQEEHDQVDLADTETTTMEILDVFHRIVHNPADTCCRVLTLDNNSYLVPPQSAFLMSDLTTGMEDLVSYVQQAGKRDLIVMDPPWPNKSVRRSSKYETQDIYDLFQIPVPELLAPHGMVAVWVTNKPKFRRFVIEKLFKSWGLQEVGIWYWLKVTVQGEPVIPLDSPHRKPYEQLILGIRQTDSTTSTTAPAQPSIPLPPRQHAIVSVPCRRHSRKPPLDTVLKAYLPDNPKSLELFARCLTPGWTSWGNECLKFQHMRFFRSTTSTSCLLKETENNSKNDVDGNNNDDIADAGQ
ncbi:MT-A70-domain-containing protein [Zychaea mexicana]|uniref:MT-A70-domain-containing protein n=1 Tax=Zychaea mexicana TaxID=64656 RepID=UPI0022FEB063|nr:MT-A70-domain-containing protein [Zychaea mexicana]KAI9494899.1 MT-A70-domain-containing protein [Zychaea mexicana]